LHTSGRLDHRLDRFFKLRPGEQEDPSALQTLNPEIHPGTGDFPQVTTAGVGFSGLDNIANGIFRQKNTSYNLGTGYLSYYVIGCLIYLEFVGLISIKYGALSPITQIQGLLSDKFLPVF
jgi:sorbitol-specific phosphotransferase system component IIC